MDPEKINNHIKRCDQESSLQLTASVWWELQWSINEAISCRLVDSLWQLTEDHNKTSEDVILSCEESPIKLLSVFSDVW